MPSRDARCNICWQVRYVGPDGDSWVCETCDESAWRQIMPAYVPFEQAVPDEWNQEHGDAAGVVAASIGGYLVNLPSWLYLAAWVFWIVWFGVWETLAIVDKGENETFSGHMKVLMWQNDRPTVVAWLVLPFLLWLIWHFYSEVRSGFTT